MSSIYDAIPQPIQAKPEGETTTNQQVADTTVLLTTTASQLTPPPTADVPKKKTTIPASPPKFITRPIRTRLDAQKCCALVAVTFNRDEPLSNLSGTTVKEEYFFYESFIDGMLRSKQLYGYVTGVMCVDENDECVGTVMGCPAIFYKPGPASPAVKKSIRCLDVINKLGEDNLNVKDVEKRVVCTGCAAAPKVRTRAGGNCLQQMTIMFLQQCYYAGFHSIVAECSSAKSVHQLISTAPLTFVRAKMSYGDYHRGPSGNEKNFGFLTPRQEKFLNYEISLVESVLPGAPGFLPHLAHIPAIQLGNTMALLRQQYARERGVVPANTRATTATSSTTTAAAVATNNNTALVTADGTLFPKAKL